MALGGTFFPCCSVDHHVPCREYSVYLLHIQSWGAAQQVAYKQLFLYTGCVCLLPPSLVLALYFYNFPFLHCVSSVIFTSISYRDCSCSCLVLFCEYVGCFFFFSFFFFIYFVSALSYIMLNISQTDLSYVPGKCQCCFLFLSASYLPSQTSAALTSLIWSG